MQFHCSTAECRLLLQFAIEVQKCSIMFAIRTVLHCLTPFFEAISSHVCYSNHILHLNRKLRIQSKAEEVQKVLTMDDQFAIGLESEETSHPAKKLAQEVPTRWTSLFALLSTVYHSYSSIKHELIEMNSIDLFLLQSELNLLGDLVNFLDAFDSWTKSIQTDYISLSNAVLMREQLYEIVTSCSSKDHKVIQDIKRKMHANWDNRIPSLGIHYLATLLDPSLKHLKSLEDYFKSYDGSDFDFVVSMLKELNLDIDDLYRRKSVPASKHAGDPLSDNTDSPATVAADTSDEVQILSAPDINTDKVDKAPVDGKLKRSLTKKEEIELLAKKKRLNLIQRYSMVDQGPNTKSRKLQIELINYRSTPDLIDEHFDLFQYWKEKRACYPGLSNLARIVHCIPATSAEIERVWSLSGLVLSSRRSKLDPQNYKHLIFVRYNWDMVKEAVD